VSVYVVDASVVLKWFLPEIHSDRARRLLDAKHEYIAPDLLFAEAGNAIWKKIRRHELTLREGQRVVADMGRIAVETVSCRVLAEDAQALANATGRTVYDCMYIALAARLNTRAITADDRLEASLRGLPAVARHVQLLQSFEPDAETDSG
jgi:predicted nucleic acid-binding protein